MKATEKQKLAMKEYDSRPENKLKKKLYMQKYRIEYEKKNKQRIKEKNHRWYLKVKDRLKENHNNWMKNNKDKWNEYRKEYYKENKDKIVAYGSEWERKMKCSSMDFKIRKGLRTRVKDAFDKYSKFGKTMTSDKYGVDYDKIIESLKPFPKDRHLYHIDHIKPLCSFDLTNPEEVRKAMSPSNHRWLLIEDNLHKVSQDKMMSLNRKKKLLSKQSNDN